MPEVSFRTGLILCAIMTQPLNKPPFETEQDPVVLVPHPIMSSACLLPVENFSQRISLIREVRNVETKENSLRRLNNNTVVIKHRQGPFLPSHGLWVIF